MCVCVVVHFRHPSRFYRVPHLLFIFSVENRAHRYYICRYNQGSDRYSLVSPDTTSFIWFCESFHETCPAWFNPTPKWFDIHQCYTQITFFNQHKTKQKNVCYFLLYQSFLDGVTLDTRTGLDLASNELWTSSLVGGFRGWMDGDGSWEKKARKTKEACTYIDVTDTKWRAASTSVEKYTTPKGNEKKKNKGAVEWKNNNNFPLSAFSHLKMAMGEEEELSFIR